MSFFCLLVPGDLLFKIKKAWDDRLNHLVGPEIALELK